MTHSVTFIIKIAIYLAAVGVLLTGNTGLFSINSWAQTSATTQNMKTAKTGELVTLNFQAAEIEAVARTFASITGMNVVVDPRVKGLLTLVTGKAVSRAVAMGQFVAALRLQGYTLVESAGLYKVVPEADAKLQSEGVTVSDGGGLGTAPGNQVVTQIFKLHFESANNLVAVLRPLISPNNTINATPGSNALVITDYADNLRRIGRIIAAMDVADATDVQIVPLKNAIASDLAPLVLKLIGAPAAPAPAGQGAAAMQTTVVAEPRANALILRAANAAQLALTISLIDKLDLPSAGAGGAAGNIHVVYLKNADATKLAATLRAAMSGVATATAPAPAPATVPAATTGGQIQADVATNSLVITAPEPQYRQMRAVIDLLDGRRAQVFVESLIAEVSSDQAAAFGIQWQTALGGAGSANIGLLGTNFGADISNIINLTTAIASGAPALATGTNIGVAHKTNGVYVLGALAHFLESKTGNNVLSTPTLLTMDNEEAKITIGQNVPFVTGQFTNTGSTNGGTVNPFQTIERKDVGLTLKVKPQISQDGTIKLTIYQEVSSIASTAGNNGPTTNKRTIETNVLVEDGAVVVLGGLLQDDYKGNQEKVPGLGDLPLFGNLFKSEARNRTKTNLMVFLRPMVVRDAAATGRLSLDRYDMMRSGQSTAQPVASQVMSINEAPMLPPAPVKPVPSAPAPQAVPGQ